MSVNKRVVSLILPFGAISTDVICGAAAVPYSNFGICGAGRLNALLIRLPSSSLRVSAASGTLMSMSSSSDAGVLEIDRTGFSILVFCCPVGIDWSNAGF